MRRTILLLSTMAVGLLLASGVALAATDVVSKTFANTEPISMSNFTAGAADPYPSEITVSGFNEGSIRDVNLKLRRFSHTFPDDVGVLLVGPDGQKVLVMSDVGASFDVSGIKLLLDDEAANPLPDNAQITSGSGPFKPTKGTINSSNPVPANFPASSTPGEPPAGPYGTDLSVFDGTDPNGTWQLFVLDDTNGGTGEFRRGWSLLIRAEITV